MRVVIRKDGNFQGREKPRLPYGGRPMEMQESWQFSKQLPSSRLSHRLSVHERAKEEYLVNRNIVGRERLTLRYFL